MDEVYELTFSPFAAISLAVFIAVLFSLVIAFFFLGADLLHALADSASRLRRLAPKVVHWFFPHSRKPRETSHSADFQTQE